MMFIYLILAIISSWIWVSYFKMINIFDEKKKIYTYLTFILGAFSYYLFYLTSNFLVNNFHFEFSVNWVNQLFISVVKVGLVGEFIKLIPIFIVYFLFKNQFTNPKNIFIYFVISAIGFSCIENFHYSLLELKDNNYFFFNEKIILRTLGEMFCTSLIAYGIIRHNFHSKHKKPLRIAVLIILAAFLHGFYDFWQHYEQKIFFSVVFTLVYFMIMISAFATILTNTINISDDFEYGKKYGSNKNIETLLKYYGFLVLFQFVFIIWNKNVSFGFETLFSTFLYAFLVVIIAVFRLNKIKVIKNKWVTLKIELPFSIYRIDTFNGRTPSYKFKFKGETFNEEFIDSYFNKDCSIYPLSHRNSYLIKSRLVHIEQKVFLKDDETFYLIQMLSDERNKYMLIKPKNSGKLLVRRKYPIVALFSIHDIEDIKNNKLTAADFQFREWVYIKHR